MLEYSTILLSRRRIAGVCIALVWTAPLYAAAANLPAAAAHSIDFEKDIKPIFAGNCLSCHGPKKQKGEYRLDVKTIALRKKGDVQPIIPGRSADSLLIQRVAGINPDKVMPPDGDTLSAEQIGLLRAWIDQGAVWPVKPGDPVVIDRLDWWSLKPILNPVVPIVSESDKTRVKNPIDAFVLAKLHEKGLTPAQPASRRTLIRRLYYDLTGLPPTEAEAAAFEADSAPDAYEKLADNLLASPRYGERWARHWMDIVHFAETHGQDQDRVRPNAWPYRDYLIEAFNHDTPYPRFIQEQLAADVLFPGEPRLTPALGFIAAGPWDESSLRDIREDSTCRQIGYYLDRDDMVTTTMSTFTSSTVHCARCHDHKFDAISQKEYYTLQAVFAGIGRANRVYDLDPTVHRQRQRIRNELAVLERHNTAEIDSLLPPEFMHEIAGRTAQYRDAMKNGPGWTVLDLTSAESKQGQTLTVQPDKSVLVSGITPETDTYTVIANTALPGITALRLELMPDESLPHKGPGRQPDNGNLHLSEFMLKVSPGEKPADEKPAVISRAAADFDQKDWTIAHAIDGKIETAWGIFPETGKPHWAVFELKEPAGYEHGTRLKFVLEQQHGRKHVIGRFRLSVTGARAPLGLPPEVVKILAAFPDAESAEQRRQLGAYFLKQKLEQELAALPPPQSVYAGAADFVADGTHRPLIRPREVHLLKRGEIQKPEELAAPGALACVAGLSPAFQLSNPDDEGARRAALARWISAPANVLTWRSMVNRVWHYHFGRGLVNTPNDLGHMGALPTHPELLDWLASAFLQSGGSLKQLHRLIVTSATYRQSSQFDPKNMAADADNQYLWRANSGRLDAESVRDAILQFSGRLDLTMGGPSVQQFSMSPGVHVTPVVDYTKYDWNAPGANRRSIYRFIFRTLPDPFMDALDCPDASQFTPVRNVSVTPLQALSLLNNRFMLRHSEIFAQKLAREHGDLPAQIVSLYRTVMLREPSTPELDELQAYAARHGMANLCRLIFNSNEFMFLD